jgi:hypothetical protein
MIFLSRRNFVLSLSLFLISFSSSEDIHGFSLCLTSIVLRGIHSLGIVKNVSVKNSSPTFSLPPMCAHEHDTIYKFEDQEKMQLLND